MTASRASVLARIALLGLIWGCSFLFMKVGLQGLHPLQIVWARLVFGAVALVAYVVLRGPGLPRRPVVWARLAFVSLVANVLPFFLFAWGEQRITSGLAGVANATTPLWTLLLAIIFLGSEHADRSRVTGLLLGFAGTVVLIAPWRGAGSGSSALLGELACLLAAASYGVAAVYMRRHLSNIGVAPASLTAAQLACATLLVTFVSPVAAWQPVHLSWAVAGSMFGLGVFGTGIAFAFFFSLIRDAGPTTATLPTYVSPVVAVVLGVLVLGEPVTWNMYVGAAVVIIGVGVAEGRLRLPGLVPAEVPVPVQPAVPADVPPEAG